jgi:hypothetical protein
VIDRVPIDTLPQYQIEQGPVTVGGFVEKIRDLSGVQFVIFGD